MATITPQIQKMLDRLPESGIPELVQNLRGLIEYYEESDAYMPPLPIEPLPKRKARMLPSVIREPFWPEPDDPPTLPDKT